MNTNNTNETTGTATGTVTAPVTETWEQKRERETAERLVKINAADARFRKILKKLGYTIKKQSEPSTWDTRTIGVKDGDAEIWLQNGGYRIGWDRVSVSGNYPRDTKGGYVYAYETNAAGKWENIECPSITVSLAKSDDQIARDIERRFLPAYEKRLAAVKEVIRKDTKYRADKFSNLETLAAVARGGRGVSEYEKNSDSFSEYLGTGEYRYPRIEVKAGDKEATIEISGLTVDQARAVIENLKKVAKK